MKMNKKKFDEPIEKRLVKVTFPQHWHKPYSEYPAVTYAAKVYHVSPSLITRWCQRGTVILSGPKKGLIFEYVDDEE